MGRTPTYAKDEVLSSAMGLFWERGYHKTSLKDLERALDMRPGSIYSAFGSKEALFRAALDRYAWAGQQALQETLAQSGSPLAGLAAYVRAMGGIARRAVPSRACMLVKTLLEIPEDETELRHSVEEMMGQMEAAFANAFRAARDAGEIASDADPARLAARLQSAIFGLRAYAQRSDTAARVEQVAEDIASDLEALAA